MSFRRQFRRIRRRGQQGQSVDLTADQVLRRERPFKSTSAVSIWTAPTPDSLVMHAVLLTVHALIVLSLIGVVLLQRSDGGALGIGGGAGGGIMSSRGAANVLTRTTSILAALFFATSIILAITAGGAEKDTDIIEGLTGEEVVDPNAPVSAEDLLNTLGSGSDAASESAPPTPEAQTVEAPAQTAPESESGVESDAEPAPEETPQD